MSQEEGAPASGKELLDLTRRFAEESPVRSWWCVGSTLAALGAALALAGLAPWWPLRLAASFLGALLFVRAFILYHDHMHRALLRRSRLAISLFNTLGLILLTPPRYWRFSHNFHHGNVGKPLKPSTSTSLLLTSDLGSFPLMSTEKWKSASFGSRLKYRLARHPLTLLFAYLTVFLLGLTLLPLLRTPRRYWDGALSVLIHGALVAGLWILTGFSVLFFSFLLPYAIAAAIGAYLFFAQHNYEGMVVLKPDEWNFYRGATESSSYMKLSPVLHWFTGNIGYHHVHHLNPAIPFYRLPEALEAIPELQRAKSISLRPLSILACLRLNLWDPEQRRLVSFGEARKAA
jgi:omega-6 fatty acid desaturase (delta-12 desaturase)